MVIVDHNKLQSDRRMDGGVDLGRLRAKFKAFGWQVQSCDGHDPSAIRSALALFARSRIDRKCSSPETIKGRGVSFMDTRSRSSGGGNYRWHAGAPSLKDVPGGHRGGCLDRVNDRMSALEPLCSIRSLARSGRYR